MTSLDEMKFPSFRPKIKRCLFDLGRPTGKNRADLENFIAVFVHFFFALEIFFRFVRKIKNPFQLNHSAWLPVFIITASKKSIWQCEADNRSLKMATLYDTWKLIAKSKEICDKLSVLVMFTCNRARWIFISIKFSPTSADGVGRLITNDCFSCWHRDSSQPTA